jgi:hypothetical protein
LGLATSNAGWHQFALGGTDLDLPPSASSPWIGMTGGTDLEIRIQLTGGTDSDEFVRLGLASGTDSGARVAPARRSPEVH